MYVHVLPWYMYIVLYEILWTALRYLLVCVLVYIQYRYWNECRSERDGTWEKVRLVKPTRLPA